MSNFSFSPIARTVSLRFKCPCCFEETETDALYVPSPNFEAETHNDSMESESYEHTCNCGELYEITLYNGFYGGSGEIDHDVEELNVDEEFEEDYDAEIGNEMYSSLYDSHLCETMKALDAIENISDDVQRTLYKVLYANIIACMESYLSDKFIHEVLRSNDNKRNFIAKFKDFEKIKIPLPDLYNCIDNIDMFIRKTLREIIYHNLSKVKCMYKNILDIELGEIDNLCRCVKKKA